MKLSHKQKADLKSLLDSNSPVRNRGITNATLSALEKRGLAEIERVPSKHTPGYKVFRWKITDAGRVALSSTLRATPEGK